MKEKLAGHLAGLNYLTSCVGTELLMLQQKDPFTSYSLAPPSTVRSLWTVYPITGGWNILESASKGCLNGLHALTIGLPIRTVEKKKGIWVDIVLNVFLPYKNTESMVICLLRRVFCILYPSCQGAGVVSSLITIQSVGSVAGDRK